MHELIETLPLWARIVLAATLVASPFALPLLFWKLWPSKPVEKDPEE